VGSDLDMAGHEVWHRLTPLVKLGNEYSKSFCEAYLAILSRRIHADRILLKQNGLLKGGSPKVETSIRMLSA
jgi:hypothetical protein